MKTIRRFTAVSVIVLVCLFSYTMAGCPPGMFGEEGSCKICPYDYYCPGDTLEPLQCPPGFTSYDGESECRRSSEEEYEHRLTRKLFACGSSSGYYCSGSTLTECTTGYYCTGNGNRNTCPRGYRCIVANELVQCASGYYSNSGDQYCHICPRGQYCTSITSQDPQNCNSGWYSYEGSTSCTQCPSGYSCSSRSQAPTLCSAGTYQPSAGQTSCINCPAGKSCTHNSASTCASGYYSLSGWSYCRPCPTGYPCTSGVLSTTACTSGQYSPEGTDACSTCTATNACPNQDEQYKCLEGYYSSSGAASCTICTAGYYCTGGSRYQCPHLTYAEDVGLSYCKAVPTHYKANSMLGATSITWCTEFQYTDGMQLACTDCDDMHQCFKDDTVEPCPTGFAKLNNEAYCRPCTAGYLCNVDTSGSVTTQAISSYESALSTTNKNYPRYSRVGETTAYVCPPNNYCHDDGTVYHICPQGTFPYITGCTQCPDGKTCLTSHNIQATISTGTKSSLGDSFPRFQPQGYYWHTGTGTWTEGHDFTSDLTSEGRIDNYYNDSISGACPTGYSCTHNMIARCPSTHLGLRSGEVGMIAENQDIIHQYDNMTGFTYSKVAAANNDVDVQCTPCNAGQSCTLGSNPSNCVAGKYSPTGDPECYTCPPGHWCAAGAEFPIPCWFNKYRADTGGTSAASCSSCSTGFYAPVGSAICTTCPAGYACSTGVPVLCAVGQYSKEGEIACSACQQGYICDKGSDIATPPANLCPKGSYCMTSGSFTLEYKCAEGKYGIAPGATNATWCQDCPPGFVCGEGTDDFSKFPCPKGYYCPLQSKQETACPAGTYNPNVQGMSSDNCLTCPAGYFCGTATVIPTICPSGSYCPLGTVDTAVPACPMGTYTGTKTGAKFRAECLPCPAGSYCVEGTVTPTPAPVGYYIPYMGATSLKAALKCPGGYPCLTTGNYRYEGSACTPGYYCPPGSSSTTENPCPAGTYSDRNDLWDPSQCTTCPAGSYCLAGSISSAITICPDGYYCPTGTQSANQYPCPTGTIGAGTGLTASSECANCTAGASCGAGTSSSSATTCSQGYYCPAGTTTSTPSDYQAPAGSFINFTGATSEYDNFPCGYGKYCPTGATGPTDCAAGTYSDILRAATCTTCPAGYYCSGTGVINPTLCSIGMYSAAGATACTLCPLGSYCHQTGTSQTTMESQTCPAGTICSRDVSGTNYGLDVSPSLQLHACPIGYYCTGGSSSVQCPAGTYNGILGAKSLDDCLTTPAGYYTTAGASEYLSTPCAVGYYCLEGSTTSTEVKCPSGTFRNITGGSGPGDCGMCPSGYQCPNEATDEPTNCGAGNYCPLGTTIPALCPVGTFSSNTNLPDSRSCTKCSTGYYCGTRGMTALTTNDYCDAGFYCVEGATRPDPTDGITGYICPAGGYCPQGTTTVQSCPAGQYNPEEGAKAAGSCINCLPGKYCAGSANPTPTGDCDAGFYCPAGATSPTQNAVSAGHYAPAGSDIEIPCPRGTYQPSNQQASCIDCPAGAYCPNTAMTATLACPKGYYCLANTYFTGTSTYYEPQICPQGTYNSLESKTVSTDCVACPAGKYCDVEGLDNYTNTCEAGFYCEFGSFYPNPAFEVNTASGLYGPCPMGSHCAADTSAPTNCVAGKYSAMTKLFNDTYCKSCEPGSYCATAGLSAPTGECTPGYYCAEGSTSATQNQCTAQNFCPEGSANEFRCPIGFYNTLLGQGKCTDCGTGYVCFDGLRSDCS